MAHPRPGDVLTFGRIWKVCTHMTRRRSRARPWADWGAVLVGLCLRVHRHCYKTHNRINKPKQPSLCVMLHMSRTTAWLWWRHTIWLPWRGDGSDSQAFPSASHIVVILMGKRLPFKWFQGNSLRDHSYSPLNGSDFLCMDQKKAWDDIRLTKMFIDPFNNTYTGIFYI